MLNVNVVIEIQRNPTKLNPIRGTDEDSIGNLKNASSFAIAGVIDFKVDNSWDELVQTAEVHIPRIPRVIRYDAGRDPSRGGFGWNLLDLPNLDELIGEFGNENGLLKDPGLPYERINFGQISEIKTSDSIGGFGPNQSTEQDGNSLIEKGDFIRIIAFYDYHDIDSNLYKNTAYDSRSYLFTGYVTGVYSSSIQNTVQIKCEDYMYYFKQLKVKDKSYLASEYSLSDIFIDLMEQQQETTYDTQLLQPLFATNQIDAVKDTNPQKYTKYTLYGGIDTESNPNPTYSIHAGDVLTRTATVFDFLKEMKDKKWAHPYFYDNSYILNLSPFCYNETAVKYLNGDNYYYDIFGTDNGNKNEGYTENDISNVTGYKTYKFVFGQNIIESKLKFEKIDDKLIGAYVKANGVKVKVSDPLRPDKKTETKPLQAFAGNNAGIIITLVYPFQITLPPVNSSQYTTEASYWQNKLKIWGEQELKKQSFVGYKGSFIAFGYPYVRHGDHINLIDPKYPERDGIYKVKRVIYTGGSNKGLRQEIFLDWKFDVNKKKK
jgi:hypothetical protein